MESDQIPTVSQFLAIFHSAFRNFCVLVPLDLHICAVVQSSFTDLPILRLLTGPLGHSTPEKGHSPNDETSTVLDPDGIRRSFDSSMPASMNVLTVEDPASFLIPHDDSTIQTPDITVNVVDNSSLPVVAEEGENVGSRENLR